MNLIRITDTGNVARLFDTGKIDLAVMQSLTYGFVAWACEVGPSEKLLHASTSVIQTRTSRVKGYYEFKLMNVVSFSEAARVLGQVLGKEVTDLGQDTDFLIDQ